MQTRWPSQAVPWAHKIDIEVNPGDKTEVRRSKYVMHESTDTDIDWDVGEARQDAHVMRESAGTSRDVKRVRWSASMHI